MKNQYSSSSARPPSDKQLTAMQNEVGATRPSGHRRATKNYFQLESDTKRQSVMQDANDRFGNRLSMMNVLPQPDQAEFQDERSIDYCCEVLQAKFGFQDGSVDNQREHVLLLLANCAARAGTGAADTQYHVQLLHTKLFGNYKEWCGFVGVKPVAYAERLSGTPLMSPLHMDLMLYFLIWGESANLRHMPECLCYLYHQMLSALLQDDQHQERRPIQWFLQAVVRPIWKECSVMQKKNSLGLNFEHTKVRNYDDMNEFFWKKGCLKIQIDQAAQAIHKTHGKTFFEHRSIFTLILNYYRIFHFNLMFLTALSVISYLVTLSKNGGLSSFEQFSQIGKDVVAPYTDRELKKAGVVLVGAQAVLNSIKCFLEVGHGWNLLVDRRSTSATSSKSMTYGLALTLRLIWNVGFSGVFALMAISKPPSPGSSDILSNLTVAALAYLAPGALILLSQSIAPGPTRTFGSKFIREGDSCYTGRHMTPPISYRIKYGIFWIILWICKAAVSYWVLVSPLMLVSLAIYEMKLTYNSPISSFHNMGIIVALWSPVVFIFNYDTQIYFTILQALIGWVKGYLMKAGEIHGIENLSKAFRVAPQLFDQKVVTVLARSTDAAEVGDQAGRGSVSAVYQSQMMLRFVVVWNEIVNSFREGDLVDDKEAAILQYDIQNTGEVFEPVFLSAGKLGEAMTYAMKLGKGGHGDSELRIQLVKNDCLSAVKSFFNASMYVMEALLGNDDMEVLEAFRMMEQCACDGAFLQSFDVTSLLQVRTMAIDFLEAVLDLPDPDTPSPVLPDTAVHPMGVIRNFVSKTESLLNALRQFCRNQAIGNKFQNVNFVQPANSYVYASRGLVNLFHSDTAMGAATRAYLLMSLDKPDAMPKCAEAQRRLGFFMKSLLMDIPQLRAIRDMRSFSVVTPFYSEGVIFSLDELNNPLENHPVFNKGEEVKKNISILKYLITIHPEEWENFLERIDVSSVEAAIKQFPMEIRLWASYRGQTLSRTVQGMMLYEDAIKILHWLEIGSSAHRTPEQKQQQLEDMVRLKFSYICACQVYGKHRAENKQQAHDIDFLLQTYPNLRVAYVDTIPTSQGNRFDTVLIKAEQDEIVEVYRYELPGDPILGEGKPENQNNALQFTRGEFLQTIDMNQQHYFEECLKMPQLLVTADLHPSKKPVSIIGMREHIFTGNASSLSKFKSWQELVFVTLSQRVLADPLYVRMHYGHPDIFDKVMCLTRGGVSKASKGINLSEDVFAGFNTTLRGGVVTHVEFMQCGKGRDVAMSQISMFEGKLANGAGETSLSREAYRMGAFMDFFRLNSMYYSHTGFYFATWMTIVTSFVYIYSKVYLALSGVQEQIVENMNSTIIIRNNSIYGFDTRAYYDLANVMNTQYFIQAGLFLTLPLICVYFSEMGPWRGLLKFINMVITAGPLFFVFQVGTTMHYFDYNIIHGNAKYQATGRGFKITRETFVLLYKAYANSHYRKAWELVGLCLVYWAYGNFLLGNRSQVANDPSNMFANKYRDTSQAYGTQTFAIWSIAIMWLLSPFIFNADGLDYEKSKADIRLWCKWMFMEESDTDPDKVNVGGWIAWWKGDQQQMWGSAGIARFTVILRESRHFLLMWYVITLEHAPVKIAFVLAAVGGSLVLLGVVHGVGLGMRGASPIARAFVYFFCLIATTIAYFVVMSVAVYHGDDNAWEKSLSLFFGYIAAMYGINEMFRVFNFQAGGVASIVVFQQLAFLFDFIFGACLLIPLFIMSCIPFMNAIQTRMMYNEGFSKVLSASSQHAFSLAAAIGGATGFSSGWLLYLLTTLDMSPGYISYASTYKIAISPGQGQTTYMVIGAAVGGSLLAGFFGFFAGRRMTLVLAGLLSGCGCLALSIIPSVSAGSTAKLMLLLGLILMGISLGLLLPTVTCYIYEISTADMRGKTMLPLAFTFVLGTAFASWYSAGEIGWVWQAFWCAVILAIMTPMMNMFPESPHWVLERKGVEECEASLGILRQKPDNADELREMREEQKEDKEAGAGGGFYKFSVAFLFTIVLSLSTNSLNIYVGKTFNEFADNNRMFTNCVVIEAFGVLISFFVIEKTPHKNLLAFTLLTMALFAGVLGANDGFTLIKLDNPNRKLILSIILGFAYFFKGLGLTSVLWVNIVGLFHTSTRFVAVPLMFVVFFGLNAASLQLRLNSQTKNAYIWLFALAGCSLIAVFFVIIAGSRASSGLICTRDEQRKDKKRTDRRRSSRHSRTPGSFGRGRHSRSRSKSSVNSYHLVHSPANGTANHV
ncbi:glycosyltransferase [Thraustotheca clavata]|uniref:1,3-beta-glucan synthase n=1 Tax=Thraustotheca clavata TaxID=74557 RepID=A0A1W0A818_9STRA|nr:glycosyltransferase [Thraustotheca clavata]